jgi:hypothetical protein
VRGRRARGAAVVAGLVVSHQHDQHESAARGGRDNRLRPYSDSDRTAHTAHTGSKLQSTAGNQVVLVLLRLTGWRLQL